MATETVLDHLDEPTQIARALDFFEEPTREARALKSSYLVHQIGWHLNQLSDREEHFGAVLKLARKLLPNHGEFDELHALLTMAGAYRLETSSVLWELSGQVLAALERGKLVEMAHA